MVFDCLSKCLLSETNKYNINLNQFFVVYLAITDIRSSKSTNLELKKGAIAPFFINKYF